MNTSKIPQGPRFEDVDDVPVTGIVIAQPQPCKFVLAAQQQQQQHFLQQQQQFLQQQQQQQLSLIHI